MEWIHVRTADKLPSPRTGESPFEQYDDGIDPNTSPAFGPGSPTMFLPVVRNTPLELDPVTDRISIWKTQGTDGRNYHGAYDSATGNWIIDYEVLPQELAVSRITKMRQLEADWDAYTGAGYPIGQYRFPLTEAFFQLLTTRRAWLDAAVAAGTVPPDRKITFSDMDGKEVSRDLTALNNQYPEYGDAYVGSYEIVVRARDEIEAAADIYAVSAITWDFG